MENQTNKKKNRWLTLVFVALNIGIIVWTAWREFASGDLFQPLQVQWLLLIPAVLVWAISCLADITKYALLMKHMTGHFRWRLAINIYFLGKYYDNITPMAVGGQPFQVYHLSKNGLSSGQAAMLPIASFMSGQFGFIILAIVCFIFGRDLIPSNTVRISANIGLAFYAFLPMVLLLFTFFPKPASYIIKGVISLFARSHLIKDKDAKIARINQDLLDYRTCLLTMLKNARMCVEIMLLSFVVQIAMCSLPYFVITAFGAQMSFIECYVTTMAIYAAITFIPTPGNAGAAEGSFYTIFSRISTGHTFWAMITWRLLCYYSYIIMGLAQMLRNQWKKRKGQAQPAAAVQPE